VSSPNESGQPGQGETPATGNGSAERGGPRPGTAPNGGRLTDPNDVPPWQRGAARPRQGGAAPRQGAEVPPRGEGRPAGSPPAGGSASIEARVNRFITGTAAPDVSGSAAPAAAAQRPEGEAAAGRSESRAERTEVARPEAYASELPDLSGAPQKPPQQRKPASERPAEPAGRAAGLAARVQVAANRSRGPVRASMQIRHIDPWSTLKVSLLLSVALFFVWMIAVAFLYLVLGGMGVWTKLNSNMGDLLTATSGGGGELVSSGTIFGGAALIGLVNIVLLTAMATIGAFIYNLSTDIVGGVEVTLADRD